jgi:hypothetical protein
VQNVRQSHKIQKDKRGLVPGEKEVRKGKRSLKLYCYILVKRKQKEELKKNKKLSYIQIGCIKELELSNLEVTLNAFAKIPSFPQASFHLKLSNVLFPNSKISHCALTASLAARSSSLSWDIDVFLLCSR